MNKNFKLLLLSIVVFAIFYGGTKTINYLTIYDESLTNYSKFTQTSSGLTLEVGEFKNFSIRKNGVEIVFGNPLSEVPGKTIIFPSDGSLLKHQDIEMNELRKTYLKRYKEIELSEQDYQFLAEELKINIEKVKNLMK